MKILCILINKNSTSVVDRKIFLLLCVQGTFIYLLRFICSFHFLLDELFQPFRSFPSKSTPLLSQKAIIFSFDSDIEITHSIFHHFSTFGKNFLTFFYYYYSFSFFFFFLPDYLPELIALYLKQFRLNLVCFYASLSAARRNQTRQAPYYLSSE